jgi:hypothetical protein
MSTLAQQIQASYLEAFKAKDTVKKEALNYVLSQIKNKKIELMKDPTDDEVIALIKKEMKSLDEELQFAQKAQKSDSLKELTQKMEILNVYLPAMLSEEQLKELIVHTAAQLGITDLKSNKGVIIQSLMKTHKTSIDGKMLNQLL